MNRVIKFKIYRENKLWGIEELRSDGWYSMCYELNPDKGERWSHIVFRDEGFLRMQFTGLLDKNGKEIWEGDVVQMAGGQKGVVRWCNELALFELETKYGEDTFTATIYSAQDNELRNLNREVIGNIYENPDLLSPSPKK